MTLFWTHWLLALLATWRVAALLVYEDGPADMIVRLRVRLGQSVAGRMMDCFQCTSVWVAAGFAFYVTREPRDWPVVWLALAGGASLLDRIHHREPAARLEFEQEGDSENELLRSETRGVDSAGGRVPGSTRRG